MGSRYERDFPGSKVYLAEESRRPIERTQSVDAVFAATGSQRRRDLIRHLFSDERPIRELDLGEGEPSTPFTPTVVRFKLERARAAVREQRATGKIPRNWKVAIIAADTQSGPTSIGENGVVGLNFQSKPEKPKDVLDTIRGIRHVSLLGQDAYYTVQSSSGIIFEPGNGQRDRLPPPLSATIHLDPDMLHFLGTRRGFRFYSRQFDLFQQSPLYTDSPYGRLNPSRITSAAAGLSIPVLSRIGAVTEVNGVSRTDSRYANELGQAISISAAGIAPEVIEAISPRALQRMNTWPLQQRMTAYALGEAN